jgi:hypothetical protein
MHEAEDGLTAKSKRYGMTLANGPPGILLTEEGHLVFKTEYSTDDGKPELYVGASGEHFCGDVNQRCVDVTGLCEDLARDQWKIE